MAATSLPERRSSAPPNASAIGWYSRSDSSSPPVEHERAGGSSVLGESGREARLADPGLAGDESQGGATSSRRRPCVLQRGQFMLAADQFSLPVEPPPSHHSASGERSDETRTRDPHLGKLTA